MRKVVVRAAILYPKRVWVKPPLARSWERFAASTVLSG